MKVDLIRKYRWYIVGLIMSFIMISISLSFCLWDDNSLKSLKASGGSGDYEVSAYKLVEDKDNSRSTTLGDIVTFGEYYQGANDQKNKTPLRWIVVDIRANAKNDNQQDLYLLAESVVAFGNFDYRLYYDGNENVWEGEEKLNQCYNDSTIRAWLNSENRSDGGEGFNDNYKDKMVFNGFYREAFSSNDQKVIIPRDLGAMMGYNDKYKNNEEILQYDSLDNQKVWIPSWTEMYGTKDNPWESSHIGKVLDVAGEKQFSYFSGVPGYGGDSKKVGKTTPFASTAKLSNYTTKLATHQANSQGTPWNYPPYDVTEGSITPVWWWIRSPHPDSNYFALAVDAFGQGSRYGTCRSYGGVRPAICLTR